MKTVFPLLLGMMLSALMAGARADIPEPDALIRDTAQEVLAMVKQDKDLKNGDQKKLLELVGAKVLPHFDFERITKLTAGRAWRTATPEQQQALVAEFRTLLVRTYTAAFSGYRNQTLEVRPPRMQPGDEEVTIKTLILSPGAPSIAVDYVMEKRDTGWKVFDLFVEGSSMVQTYRGTFAEQIQKSGVDGLIKSLADKNRANASAPLRKAESK